MAGCTLAWLKVSKANLVRIRIDESCWRACAHASTIELYQQGTRSSAEAPIGGSWNMSWSVSRASSTMNRKYCGSNMWQSFRNDTLSSITRCRHDINLATALTTHLIDVSRWDHRLLVLVAIDSLVHQAVCVLSSGELTIDLFLQLRVPYLCYNEVVTIANSLFAHSLHRMPG